MTAAKFRFNGPATVLHLNTRKTGDEDDRVLSVDVKFSAKMTSRDIIGKFAPELHDALFTDIGAARNEMLGPLTFAHELAHYRITSDLATFTGCTIRKFSVEPADVFAAVVTFVAAFQPSSTDVAKLAEYLTDEIEITIEPENGELDL